MRLRSLLTGFVVLMGLSTGSAYAQMEVTLHNPPTEVYENCINRLNIRYTYTPGDGSAIEGATTGFRVWTTNNGYTDRPDSLRYDSLRIPGGWINAFDLIVLLNSFSNDGIGEDTVGFGGARLFKVGLVDPFDEDVLKIRVPIGAQAGDTLCIDSSFFPPAGNWLWATDLHGNVVPGWGGPYCFPITTCCPVPDPCEEGVCCGLIPACIETTQVACENMGGAYRGDGTTCAAYPCTNLPPGPDNDSSSSLGVFRIYIDSVFRPLIEDWTVVMSIPPCGGQISANGCYGGSDAFRLTSPVLSDRETIIGRSDPHLDGSHLDTIGTATGTGIYATIVKDGDFQVLPPFEGPDGNTEIHTAVAKMELEDLFASGIKVRAGHSLGLPLSPGEVESKTGDFFPGESFFNIYIEVTLPGLGSPPEDALLINSDPLLIVNDSVTVLPPKVIYTHENTTAVPVRFANSHSSGDWNAGDLLGYLVLAGHGYRYSATKHDRDDLSSFLTTMNEYVEEQGEVPLTCCNGDGIRGNVDGITGVGGPIDVADLSFMVDYLFKAGPVPPCIDEGNVDGITGVGGPIDVADLSYLVDYLFKAGPAPPSCPFLEG